MATSEERLRRRDADGDGLRPGRRREPARASAGGRRRRRHHRRLRRLPSGPAGLDRRRRPRAQPGLQRHELARRRSHDAHARHARADGPRELQPRLLPGARGALRRRHRLPPERFLSVARTTERMVELGYGLTMAHHHGLPARRAHARRDRRRLAAPRRRRPRRRRALRTGRDREPRHRGLRHRQGGLRPRRALRRRRQGDRLPPRGRPRDRRRDRSRTGRLRGRGDRRRSLVARPGAARGSPPAAARGGALLGADRADGRGQPRPADRPRPRRLLLRAPLPRRPHRGRLRARRAPAHHRLHPRGLLVRGVRARPGALRAASLQGPAPGAGSRGGALRALPGRARELHARRQLPARRDGGGRRPLRRRRHELAGHHLRSGSGPRPGGVDRRGRADHRRLGPRRAPLLPGPGQRRLPVRAHARVARAPVRDALAVPAAGDGARAAARAALRPARRRRSVLRRDGRLGAGRLVRTGRLAAGVRVLLRPPELVRRRRRRAPCRARGRRALRPLVLREAARRGPGGARRRPARLLRRSGPAAGVDGVHVDAQRTRRHRARRDRDPARRRPVLRGRADGGAGEDVPLAAPPRRPRGGGHRRHLGAAARSP